MLSGRKSIFVRISGDSRTIPKSYEENEKKNTQCRFRRFVATERASTALAVSYRRPLRWWDAQPLFSSPLALTLIQGHHMGARCGGCGSAGWGALNRHGNPRKRPALLRCTLGRPRTP
ncbi:unnamed protein product [Amoebophrya sp. A25]|nr:unnamed protein product [Amoebophrya sp. A25]|eukprot:GSA25T00025320001.1